MLGAQRAAYQDLRAQAIAAVGGLRTEPGYQGLLSRLAAMATRAAGPGAAVTAQPEGGVLARAPACRGRLHAAQAGGLAVDELGDQVRELWTP